MTGRRIGLPIAIVIALLVATSPVGLAAGEGTLSASVRVSPLTARLELSATNISLGRSFKATVVVSNLGTALLREVVADLRLDGAGLVVDRPGPRTIAQIRPGKTGTASWLVCAAAPGTYVLLGQATLDGFTIDSPARIVTVIGGGRRSCS